MIEKKSLLNRALFISVTILSIPQKPDELKFLRLLNDDVGKIVTKEF